MEPPSGTRIEDSGQPGRHVLRPANALDQAASPELREAIGRTLSHGPGTLVIDLAGVSSVDAAGLAVLVYACRASTAAHVKLVLSSPSPLVQQLLEPTRLGDLCDIELETSMPVPIRDTAA